jgi:hypothetical protein
MLFQPVAPYVWILFGLPPHSAALLMHFVPVRLMVGEEKYGMYVLVMLCAQITSSAMGSSNPQRVSLTDERARAQ